jgi:L-2-aminoadipate reductase
MPLNPNGKIDKPALPFPDTAQAAAAVPSSRQANATEEAMQAIWASILPNPVLPIPLDESFFDLGGHSILATRLVFQIRKTFVVNAPLGLVFNHPTIAGLVSEVEALRNADLGLYDSIPSSENAVVHGAQPKTELVSPMDYGQDYLNLLPKLRESYPPLPTDFNSVPLTVFLTGATGFLGAFILRNLLSREAEVKKVICLIRAPDNQRALQRLREASTDREVWDEDWIKNDRLEVISGDLTQPLFRLGETEWSRVATQTDVILHNGALVCITTHRICLNAN